LKEKALDRTLWRTRFGREYGLVVRQTTEWDGFIRPTDLVVNNSRVLAFEAVSTGKYLSETSVITYQSSGLHIPQYLTIHHNKLTKFVKNYIFSVLANTANFRYEILG
jgi:hypothetical protein